MDLGPGELAIILVILLVLFGGKKLPQLARSLGQAKRELESASKSSDEPATGAPEASAEAPVDESPARSTTD
jgi:sec-independent protein translocase protein TatA